MPSKKDKRFNRHKRVRSKISGTKERPRLCVFRSNKHLYAQLLDDYKGKTLLSVNNFKIKTAKALGEALAKKAKELKIEKVVFDRGGYKYHGKIKDLADGAREGGLIF